MPARASEASKIKQEVIIMHNLNLVLPVVILLGIGGIICAIKAALDYALMCVTEADKRAAHITAERRAAK